MARLAGKVAFITGGGGGIGRATAECFAEEGAEVANMAVYLASDESEITTGQILSVDSGATIY